YAAVQISVRSQFDRGRRFQRPGGAANDFLRGGAVDSTGALPLRGRPTMVEPGRGDAQGDGRRKPRAAPEGEGDSGWKASDLVQRCRSPVSTERVGARRRVGRSAVGLAALP